MKLHIGGKRTNAIGDDGLLAIAQHCPNIKKLVLIGLYPTSSSLGVIAINCLKLWRVSFSWCNTVGDAEIAYNMADKCVSLRKLWIKECPISSYTG
ncbi:hypothetical protein QQ045_007643 [Rhodiola kirilowii]